MSMWDDRYATGWAYGEQPNDFLVSVANQLPAGGRVLCLAEGQGRNAVFLAQQGHTVTAVDLSTVGLTRTRELAASRGVTVETVHADLAAYDLGDGAWDAIIAIWAHTPSAVRRPLHRNVARALRVGGAFVVESYRPEQIALGTGGPKDKDLLPTADELREDLAGLDLVQVNAIERDVHEGALHAGRSAVVQLLGFRRSPVGATAATNGAV